MDTKEIMEEFSELTAELAKLVDGFSTKEFRNKKNEIHEVLERLVDIFDELELALEVDESGA